MKSLIYSNNINWVDVNKDTYAFKYIGIVGMLLFSNFLFIDGQLGILTSKRRLRQQVLSNLKTKSNILVKIDEK